MQSKLVNVPEEIKLSKLQIFKLLFSVKFIKIVMIPAMNKLLFHAIRGKIDYKEFLAFLRVLLKMSTSVSIDQSQYWSTIINKDK